MTIIVFSGPTLSAQDVLEVLEAECLPPAAQGDVYRAALRRPSAIGIIDGYFESVPSIWHKEILWAMAEGIHVFGSASMGALRAAELAPFGMVGVGAVFEAYRDGVLEDDDEVAVAHGPTADSYRFSSDAMVNMRATLARATAGGVIQPVTQEVLQRIAKSLFYQERSWARVLERARAEEVPPGDLLRLADWLPTGEVNVKREDALLMLHTMRDFLASDPGPKEVAFEFEETLYWEELVRSSGEIAFYRDGSVDALVLEELARHPELRMRAEAAAVGWRLASEYGRRRGRSADASALLETSREFCERHGLTDPGRVEDWAQRNRCNSRDVERLLELRTQAHTAEAASPAASAATLLDFLRWTGDYEVLAVRAARTRSTRGS